MTDVGSASWPHVQLTGDRYRQLRRKTFEFFEPGEGGLLGRHVDVLIMALIAGNVLAIALETVDAVTAVAGPVFSWLEAISVAIFAAEYVCRIWSAVEREGFDGAVRGRLRYASKPLLVIDLLAIAPVVLAAAGVRVDLRVLRAVRLVRIVRVLKLARYSTAMESLLAVFRDEREKLVLAVFANALLLVLASSAMYTVEHPHQPEAFSSIPATMYWAVVTLTTVGYGDVTPVTTLGQLFTGVIAVLGMGLFALPASILSSGFMEQADSNGSDWEYCPHCGDRLD